MSFVIRWWSVDVSQGEEESERGEAEEMGSEELARVVKEQRNYIEILKTALREVLDQNDEVGIYRQSQSLIIVASSLCHSLEGAGRKR